MPARRCAGRIALVPNRRRFTLEVEVHTDPPVGSLCNEQGTSIAFTGWLGLASALERFIAIDSQEVPDVSEE